MKRLLLTLALLFSISNAANAAVYATANAAVYVTVESEGGYSYPCVKRGQVCRAGIVVLLVNGVVSSDHLVRCPHPRRLHVEGMIGGKANVFACSRYYHWGLW